MAKFPWAKAKRGALEAQRSYRVIDYLRPSPQKQPPVKPSKHKPLKYKPLKQTSSRQRSQATVWVQRSQPCPPWLRFALGLFFWVGLIAGAGLSVSAVWLGFQSLVTPQSSGLLAWFWPQENLGQAQPQTLAEIEAEATAAGFSLGSIQRLSSAHHGTEDWLVPILRERQSCDRQCWVIDELRIYRPLSRDPEQYQLRDRTTVTGPTEAFVLDPIVGTLIDVAGAPRPLPLVEVQPLPNGKDQVLWLTLQGTWTRNHQKIQYGQLIRYDPKHARLALLSDWTSPANRLPYWRELDGNHPPELLIDQRVGLEPSFLAYQIKPSTAAFSLQPLQPISLLDPVFEPSRQMAGYHQALTLARSGLWSTALSSLEDLKHAHPQVWSPAAEAQLALIALHAQVTQAQAHQTWSSGTQKILAYLRDGRWQAGLTLLTETPELRSPMLAALAVDSGALWTRIQTILQVDPQHQAAQTWGLLLLTAQADQETALAWLARQANADAARQQYQAIMTDVEAPPDPIVATTTATTAASSESETAIAPLNLGPVMGTPMLTANIEPSQWYRPGTLGAMPTEVPQWFRVPILALQADGNWQRGYVAGDNLSSAQLWQSLGLTQNRQLQLFTLGADSVFSADHLTIQGIQRQGNRLWLLASGYAPIDNSENLLAASPNTLRQLTVNRPLSFPDLRRTQPDVADQLATQLQQRLGIAPDVLLATAEPIPEPVTAGDSDANPSPEIPTPTLPIAFTDVTGNGGAEIIIRLTSTGLAAWGDTATSQLSHASTLIFTPSGTLLFSDLQAPYQLVAITPAGRNGAIALMVYHQGTYQLWPWSSAAQRFQAL